MIRSLERRVQPYRFGIPEGALAEWLAPLGLRVVSDLSELPVATAAATEV